MHNVFESQKNLQLFLKFRGIGANFLIYGVICNFVYSSKALVQKTLNNYDAW